MQDAEVTKSLESLKNSGLYQIQTGPIDLCDTSVALYQVS